jgi:hypothetical protein
MAGQLRDHRPGSRLSPVEQDHLPGTRTHESMDHGPSRTTGAQHHDPATSRLEAAGAQTLEKAFAVCIVATQLPTPNGDGVDSTHRPRSICNGV